MFDFGFIVFCHFERGTRRNLIQVIVATCLNYGLQIRMNAYKLIQLKFDNEKDTSPLLLLLTLSRSKYLFQILLFQALTIVV